MRPPRAPLSDLLAELREQHRARQHFLSIEGDITRRIKSIHRRLNAAGEGDQGKSGNQALTETPPAAPNGGNGAGGHATSDTHRGCADGASSTKQRTGNGHTPRPHQELAAASSAPFSEIAAWATLELDDLRARAHTHRNAAELRMRRIARQLPCFDWCASVHGFGELGFAQILAEAGDLSVYANPAKLWKRFGLAVLDGEAQRRARGAKGIEHGFSPRRRAVMHCVGDAIVRAGKGPYRELYDTYKAAHAEQHPDLSAGHVHKRAMRYAEKRLLRDLWARWRQEI